MIVSAGEALMDMTPAATPGGGPMNVAIAAARLGVPAAFLGRLSNDAHGDALAAHIASNGVDMTLVQRGPEPTALAHVDPGPPLRFRFEGDGTADTALDPTDLANLTGAPRIFHGGTLGMFRGRTAHVLASIAETFPGIVSLDPNVRPQIIEDRAAWLAFHERWIGNTDVYKASDEDIGWIFPGREPASVAAELLARRCALVAVTAGGDGATLYTDDDAVTVAAPAVDVVDTVGAGDTFVASILADLHERTDGVAGLRADELAAIGTRAAAAAAITCSRVGADPPTRAELH